MVTTRPNEPFSHAKVAVWCDDHWRTPKVGRFDGDCRIPDGNVVAWSGPLTPPAPPAGEQRDKFRHVADELAIAVSKYGRENSELRGKLAEIAELQATVERLEGELAVARAELVNVTEIRQTLDAHICEACEMLGLNRHEVPCDSWTLREKIASAMKQLAAKGEEVERN